MKLAELKDVIKADLVLYESTECLTFNNVDVTGNVFIKYQDYEVIGIRTIVKYVPHIRKNVAYIVVSIRQSRS